MPSKRPNPQPHYRHLSDLSRATGLSASVIKRAIERQVIKPEWLYISPASGRRKVKTTCFQSAVDALNGNWEPRPNQVKQRRHGNGKARPQQPYEVLPDGTKAITLEQLAVDAGVPLSLVHECIGSGKIPLAWLVDAPKVDV